MKTIIFMIIGFGILAIIGCSGKRPRDLGIKDGRLTSCPKSPNCVSSQAKGGHYIEPITYTGSRENAREMMLNLLREQKRVKIVTSEESYIHVEFRSAFFRFVDDLELYFPETEGIIHVRSASRVGYSDMGVNRKRVENLRKRFSSKYTLK